MSNTDNPLTRRCPRLGGSVYFGYCEKCGEGQTCCFKILDCWWEIFDVGRYLEDTLGPEEFRRLESLRESGPKAKMASLMEIAQKAAKNQG